jgi:hypothetical protein
VEVFDGDNIAYGVINKHGTEIIAPTYEKAVVVDGGTVLVQFISDADTGRSRVGTIAIPSAVVDWLHGE